MKALLPTGLLLVVCVCLEIVFGVEVKQEPAANGTDEFVEAVSTEAGAPKGYWNLRSWVRFESVLITVFPLAPLDS